MFRIEVGQIMKSLMITCMSLDVRLLCIFPKMRGLSLMLRQDLVYLLAMVKMSLVTGFMIWCRKKLVRSQDVVFMENHTIQNIEKTDATESQCSDDLIDLDPIPLIELPTQVEDEAHNDQHDMGDVETPIQVEMDDNVHEQSPVAYAPLCIPLRRSTRDRHPSTQYSIDNYVLLTDGGEPESYEEAMEDENKMKWVDALQDEMKSLHENHSFELVKLPKGKRALKNRWVYKVKQEEHTSRARYKARLVIKGFSQKKGIDFDEIFSPVVKMLSILVVLGLATSLDLEIEHMDVKTTFLHGDLDKEIYMERI